MRINLYNYRSREIYYRKLRLYALAIICMLIAIIINLTAYLYIQLEIANQEARNKFLTTQISIINSQILPIRKFKATVKDIENKVKIINAIDHKRDISVAILQKLYLVIPERIYLNSMSVSRNGVDFKGTSAGPLPIAVFLDKLRESSSPFNDPILKSNDTKDQIVYNFEITANLNLNNLNVEYESNGI